MLFKVRSPFLVEKDYKERTTVSEIDLKSDDDERLQRKALNILMGILTRHRGTKTSCHCKSRFDCEPYEIWSGYHVFPRGLIQTCHRRARCGPSSSTMLPGMKSKRFGASCASITSPSSFSTTPSSM
jgi:hypothetical protein